MIKKTKEEIYKCLSRVIYISYISFKDLNILIQYIYLYIQTRDMQQAIISPENNLLNTIVTTKMLFKSEFQVTPDDELTKRKIFELKLNNQYSDTLQKYKKAKEKEEELRLKQTTKKQKKQNKESEQEKTFTHRIVNQLIAPKEKEHKIKTFDNYVERIHTTIPEETSNALVPAKRLEMNLAQTTKLGTIRSSSIRKLIKPTWHKPYKLYRVVAAHQGWVRCISVSPDNTFFCTGSNDRTIKFWDLASGKLKITLTGHINAVRGMQLSKKMPYLFSCAQDKTVKCWDLEMNKVVRNYHGHLSGVYCLRIHDGLNLLVTGGRDSAARVWDIRLRTQVHTLVGHGHTVGSVVTQQFEPQVITGSYDSQIRTWDLVAGKCLNTLTNHKKSVRALVVHPTQYTFASAASDNIKVWKCPEGSFLRNISGHNSIINSLSINHDNVLTSAGDDGTLKFWDWKSGYNFQSLVTKPQPGSISAETGIYCTTFDRSGTRLITGQCDKTIKFWKQDDEATEQTHPVSDFKIEFDKR